MEKKENPTMNMMNPYDRVMALAKKSGVAGTLKEIMPTIMKYSDDIRGIPSNQVEMGIVLTLITLAELGYIRLDGEWKDCTKCKKNSRCYDAKYKYSGGCHDYEEG